MANPESRTPPSRGSSRSALIIVGVLALLGLAYAIARVDILRARIVEVRIDLDNEKQNIAMLRGELLAVQENQQRSNTRLSELQAAFTSLNDNLSAVRGRAEQAEQQSTRGEAQYLLRLANEQLRFAHDIDGALNTLVAAASVLSSATDGTLSKVHQQVVTTLEQLRAVPRPDLANIEKQLSAAEQQVSELKLAGIMQAPLDDATSNLPSAGAARAWAMFKRGLSRLFAIHNTGDATNVLVTADEQLLRRRHLQLLLLNARLTLQLRDQPGYVTTLHAAEQWLAQRFDLDNAQVRQFSTQLKALAEQNIAPATPDLSASIAALTSP